jgi:hypothetical protein
MRASRGFRPGRQGGAIAAGVGFEVGATAQLPRAVVGLHGGMGRHGCRGSGWTLRPSKAHRGRGPELWRGAWAWNLVGMEGPDRWPARLDGLAERVWPIGSGRLGLIKRVWPTGSAAGPIGTCGSGVCCLAGVRGLGELFWKRFWLEAWPRSPGWSLGWLGWLLAIPGRLRRMAWWLPVFSPARARGPGACSCGAGLLRSRLPSAGRPHPEQPGGEIAGAALQGRSGWKPSCLK